ncbi:MAG: ABC transporter permease [Puniceicoccaceae bacterium]
MMEKRSNNTGMSQSSRFKWILRMAWRDSRGKRLLLLLFTFSIVFGVGSIVAIYSLRENLQRIVDEQSRSLLGADAVFQTRRPPPPELERYIQKLPGEKVSEMRFRSMAVFPQADNASRFVQVRAIGGALPFYGKMELTPERMGAAAVPATDEAFVEESILLQLGLEQGGLIRLGEKTYTIAASLVQMAGESEVSGFFAPRIYIPLEDVEETGLIQTGSMIRYRSYVGIDQADAEELAGRIAEQKEDLFVEHGVDVETVADRRRSIERILDNLLDFLNLIGFSALLLGGIGIIGAVNVYLQAKRETIAILRCLGTRSSQAFSIYLIQMLIFGMAGAIAGTLLGIGVQFILPPLLQSFLPFDVTMKLSSEAILTGLGFGWFVVLSSALIPLLSIRHISPLRAIRAGIEPIRSSTRDPLVWLTALLLAAGLLVFTVIHSRQSMFAFGFVAGLVIALGMLAAVAFLLRLILRRLRTDSASYSYRIALSNLYRPNNRTLLMIVSLGMGLLLINTLLLTRDGLLEQVKIEPTDDAANVILVDVQPDQLQSVDSLLTERGLPPHDTLPIVTMRVEKIKDIPMREWKRMEDSPVSDWIYTWEFRNTYRDHVLDNAEVIDGKFIREFSGDQPYPISLSENVIEDIGVGVGDSITWNVQGVSLETVVSSIRDVKWKAGRQNFNVVFPLGTIEAAPTVYAVTIKTESRLETAQLNNALANSYPNISLIDLSLVFDSLNEILSKATFVIKFMAGFTVATGLVVLAGALMGSRYQRMRESVLFRTLGASTAFIRRVLSLEFVLLGLIASLSGILLSWLAAWALFEFVFTLPFEIKPISALVLGALLTGLTLLTGWLTSRGIASQPPLVILRKE